MRTKITQLDTIDVVFENGKVQTFTLTPREMAGLKRSAKWKNRISVKKIVSVTTIVKVHW